MTDAVPLPPVGTTVPFRILVVCTGNVCRSPLAERLLRAKLDAALGADARSFEVASAGTAAVVGAGIDRRAAAVGKILNASVDGFVARAVTAADVAAADLVLAATRDHRAAVVRLHPRAHRYAFTIREFARLAAAVAPDELPAGDPVGRGRALVAAAARGRGTAPPPQPTDDDVTDPHGGVDRVHQEVGVVLDRALRVPVDLLAGRAARPPAPTRAVRRARDRVDAGHGRRTTGGGGDLPPVGATSGPRGGGRRRSAPGRTAAPRSSAGRRRARRLLLRSALGLLALLLLGGGWLAVRGVQAQRALVQARADVTTVRTELLAGDAAGARTAVASAQQHSRKARAATEDPVWRLAAATPYVGSNAAAVRTLASAVDSLAGGVLPSLVQADAVLDPARLRPAGDRIDVSAVARQAPILAAVRADVVATRDRLSAVDTGPLLGPVAGAVTALRTELTDAARSLDGVTRASRLLPPMLGAGGTRRYLVVFQNNAEARGTGGLVGAYAVVSVRDGRLRVDRIGSNTDLRSAETVPVDLGPDFVATWGQDPALWGNSNLDANFPNAARIWLALWERQTGQALDGVLATDPVALGYLLTATGSVRLGDGETIGGDNAARLTMRDVYSRSDDNTVRDSYLRSVAGSVVRALVAGRGSPRALVTQLGRAAGEHRLQLYSAHEAEQREIVGTSLSGLLSRLPGSYAYVTVNNAGGNKMDYYLRRSVDYVAGPCSGGRRTSRITATFGNAAPDPSRLPVYVAQRLDAGTATRMQSTADGALVELVSVYGPLGSGVLRATLDGRPLTFRSGRSAGRPVWTFPLVVPHGAARTLVLDVSEPALAASPVVPVQPLVRAATVTVTAARCS